VNPRNFFAELKRRNVYKVAVAYAVVGWLVIQISSTVLPTFHAPEWVVQTLVVLVALGFPIALVLAWAFELTPEGIKRAEDVASGESITRKTGRKLVGITVALAVIGAGLFAFQWLWPKPTTPRPSEAAPGPTIALPPIPEKSIAVLPFENLSSDKENAYFVAGIQDEILTRLAKIGALKVISRLSTQQYQSKPGNLREIARQLGVANILEGSVQKVGPAVHVNVQLIKALTDDHLWAESYDRTLDNIFGVEGEIAQMVAEALNARLTGAEQKVLAQRPTTNPAAYDAYLRGSALSRLRDDESELRAAQVSFEEAVRLDPQFAAAWAALSRTHSLLFFLYDATPARQAEAERALAEAVRLQPDLAETQLARAYLQYWVRRDYTRALEMMRQLRTSWPNNAEVLEAMALISPRLGQWKESLDYIQQSMALNPKDLSTRIQALEFALAVRDFALVIRLAEEGLQTWPGNSALLGLKASAFQARGQLDEAQSILARVKFDPANTDAGSLALMYQTVLRRDPAVALKFLNSYPQAADENDPKFLPYWAVVQEAAGRKNDARATFTRVRDMVETLLTTQPQNAGFVGILAFTLAALDQRDDALKAVDQFAALSVGDARAAGQREELSARVFAHFGDKERAISSLERLLSAPSDGLFGVPVTPALLRLDPTFDPLRSDPRFQKLCQEPAR
jgi:TolB-like protein/predicted Zn-dependent protease